MDSKDSRDCLTFNGSAIRIHDADGVSIDIPLIASGDEASVYAASDGRQVAASVQVMLDTFGDPFYTVFIDEYFEKNVYDPKPCKENHSQSVARNDEAPLVE